MIQPKILLDIKNLKKDVAKHQSDISYLISDTNNHTHSNSSFLEHLNLKFKVMTQEEYAGLASKDQETLYLVLED